MRIVRGEFVKTYSICKFGKKFPSVLVVKLFRALAFLMVLNLGFTTGELSLQNPNIIIIMVVQNLANLE